MYAVAMYSVAVSNSNFLSIFFMQLIFSVTPIIADVGLWFVKSPEPFVAPINDDVVFDCSLNVPAEVIRWRHDRKYLLQNRTLSPRGSANQLIIKVESESQLGDYQCVAWFGASALASVPAKLTLAEMKPFPLHQPEKRYVVTAGNMVSIFCPPPVSNPVALIQYYHDDRKLPTSNDKRILPTSNSLLLMHVTAQDSGIYTCSATNYITGQTMHSPFRVNLTVVPNQSVMPSAPKFLSQPQTNYIVQTGSNVTIECVAVGEPSPRVLWYKVGDPQRIPNNRTELLPGGLHLRNIVLEDTGEYVCEVDNDLSPVLRHKVLLQVHEAPIIIREPNRTLVEEQEDTELSCVVSGTPIPTVSWTLNGELLENDNHVHVSSSKLILRSVQKKHAGIYQCFASNSVGTAYGSAMVQVSPKQIMANINSPGSPYNQNGNWPENIKNNRSGSSGNRNHGGHGHGKKEHPRKNKGKRKHKENDIMVPPSKPNVTRLSDSSVMVRWHVPSNNGLPISFFKVQHREVDANETGKGRSGGNRWMTSNEDIPSHIRSYEVDRLETNQYYKFRVAAVYSNNDNKLSPSSYKFFLHQGTPAERSHLTPPTQLHAEALSPNSIEIKWLYLNSVLSPVDGFYVYYRATNNAGDYVKATVEGEKRRSFVITHLEADTSYDIKIQSFTIGAASNFSTIVTHKTLIDPNSVTSEIPSRNDLKTPTVSLLPPAPSNTFQLLLIFGGILGSLALLFFIFVLICYLKQRAFRDSSNEDENTPDKNNDNIMSIHPVEPVTMNGYTNHSTHNGNSYNGKMNGNAVKTHIRNGYIAPHSHMNITSNPLAADIKHEKNMMEMSYLSKYNNNCTIDRCGDSDSDCSRDMNKWRVLEQRPTEKYV